MILFLRFAAIAFVVVCFSCNSGNKSTETAGDITSKVSADSVFAGFAKINLPIGLPAPEINTAAKEIDNATIKQIFAGSGYKPAFGEEKDIPDLADNAESAHFFAEGMFQTDGYTAVIIRKTEEQDTYYYLSTFAPGGQFIQGMCIAFSIGENAETERIASINDDFSIQIRQTDKQATEPAAATQNIFYEISGDGQIQQLKTEVVQNPV